jgi:hypothetical protein
MIVETGLRIKAALAGLKVVSAHAAHVGAAHAAATHAGAPPTAWLPIGLQRRTTRWGGPFTRVPNTVFTPPRKQ